MRELGALPGEPVRLDYVRSAGTGTARRPKRSLVIGSVLLMLLCLGAAGCLAVTPKTASSSQRLVVGSLPFWNLTAGAGVVAAHAPAFTEVSPWIYGLGPHGQIVDQVPARAAETTAAMNRLRALGIPLVPTIANVTNGRWAYEPVAALLDNPDAMDRHISDIVTLVSREGYAGIDIDYEDLRGSDRKVFTAFITRLAGALHAKGKTLSVAVFAKTSDAGEDQRNVAQDYAALGAAADQIRLMAYDYHWDSSAPGPVAPITWIRQVIDYAKTVIPVEKIVLGIPTAGYDWVDGHGEPVSWMQCFSRTTSFHATLHYDGPSESPWFRYTDGQGRQHEVWFENADSMAAKLHTARDSGIRGVYLWMFGGEDERTWTTLTDVVPAPGADGRPG